MTFEQARRKYAVKKVPASGLWPAKWVVVRRATPRIHVSGHCETRSEALAWADCYAEHDRQKAN